MGTKYESIGSGVLKRRERRVLGLFIDGTGLDRATRRLKRKVDLSRLVRGVTSGSVPIVARYYTLIPYEDDSRQRAFLDAVHKAGLTVIVKRLPPKGVSRQVSVDVEMAADIVAFAQGHTDFSDLSAYDPKDFIAPAQGSALPTALPFMDSNPKARKNHSNGNDLKPRKITLSNKQEEENIKRIVTVVCPSREISYPIALARELGAETATADFGQFNSGDILKSAAKWIDLSDSETIWRE
ncbi:MAG: NYN domain-containing protein [Deltaproteobacteria bacterium]|nr:NYN domain-containing protein [Deltaproteobacteria bacterium]